MRPLTMSHWPAHALTLVRQVEAEFGVPFTLAEMIIRGGENIYPREIEAVLTSHPGVAEAAVVGVPDRFWGEVVGAVIRPAFDVAEAELADYCRGRLAACKTPVRWLFTDGFPLTSTGKIRKDVL